MAQLRLQALEKDELMVSQGEDYKDIAAKLGISENMVKHHLKRVVDKMHREKIAFFHPPCPQGQCAKKIFSL